VLIQLILLKHFARTAECSSKQSSQKIPHVRYKRGTETDDLKEQEPNVAKHCKKNNLSLNINVHACYYLHISYSICISKDDILVGVNQR